MKKTTHVVLDLDQTLIESVDVELRKKPDFEVKIENTHYYVYKRPGLDKFINGIFTHAASVSVWTAATRPYCMQIIKNIFTEKQYKKLRFIWSRNQTINKDGFYYLKDMSKVFKKFKNMNRKNTILIDDNPNHFVVSPDCVKYISGWSHTNIKDGELSKMLKMIKSN